MPGHIWNISYHTIEAVMNRLVGFERGGSHKFMPHKEHGNRIGMSENISCSKHDVQLSGETRPFRTFV